MQVHLQYHQRFRFRFRFRFAVVVVHVVVLICYLIVFYYYLLLINEKYRCKEVVEHTDSQYNMKYKESIQFGINQSSLE